MDAPNRHPVLLIVSSLAAAGGERITCDIAIGAKRRGWDIRVLAYGGGPFQADLDRAGVPTRISPRFTPRAVAATVAAIRESRPAVLHTHLIRADLVGGVAARLAPVPVRLSTQHDDYGRAKWALRARRVLARDMDAVVACSPTVVDYCRTAIGVEGTRLHSIPNGVDTGSYSPAPLDRDPGGGVVFGAVGSLIGRKRHAQAVRALALVREEVPGARLVIAGQGEERDALVALAESLGVADAVDLPGRSDDVAEFLRGLDAFVHPSVAEGLAVAVLEAMASGLPIVAGDIPSLREGLGVAALFAADDPRALADGLVRVARDEELARRLGAEARRRVEDLYSLDRMVDDYTSLWERLIAAAGV